ncbi:MAG: ABC transporter ATP-binding protein/permease [Comamonadaceae bacterium]|nr:MAG: ABC transporter ATP-binding protein/permease [Comamonadaceae bacterium]
MQIAHLKSPTGVAMSLAEKSATFKSTARKIWALTVPYFRSEDKWKARAMLAGIVILNLAAVFMLVQINDWYGVFYNALQTKNQPVFWEQLVRFTYLAFIYIIISVYKFYLTQLLQIRWRAWMTDHYLTRWLAAHTFYKLELARYSAAGDKTPDNPDQRIQEDVRLFTEYSVGLSMGLLNAAVTLVSFVGILWGLSGAFDFNIGGTGYSVPGFMVWMALLYCVAGSIVTHYIGRPQIRLNFEQQRYEANFRHDLVRVREYSESIALDRGETVERSNLDTRFSAVLANYLLLLRKQKNLVWFTNFFGQAAVVFPFIVSAPRFFGGALDLGQLMQIVSAFGKVQDSLSWFVDNYSSLAAWRATTDRLTSFEDHLTAQTLTASTPVEVAGGSLAVQDLSVALPSGALLLGGVNLKAAAGDSILISGPSGSGKSTLFRAFAGIWPFARGQVTQPANAMFIPQRPYFPNGPLRNALAYPDPAGTYSDDALRQALGDALLPQLAGRLDDEDAWSQKLSGGEQQRLAIARVLLKKPAWVFADEATSALDEPAEKALYDKLLAQVRQAGGAIVSIAHRPAVAAFHGTRWEFEKAPEGSGSMYRLQSSQA